MIKLNDIKVSVDYTDNEIKQTVAKRLKIKSNSIKGFDVVRRSIDARYSNVRFSLGVQIEAEGFSKEKQNISSFDLRNIDIIKKERPVIIGAGPAGMFAALVMAQCGMKPVIIERGQSIEQRKKQVAIFQSTGKLDVDSNVCFGEGGAGTFSDGKLVTRVNDEFCSFVLKTFVEHGASDDIMIDARPHIGTDILSDILIKIRKSIIDLGGEVSFGERMLDVSLSGGKVKGIKTNKRMIECENVILATGHGARDVYEMLSAKQIHMQAKGFALGVRIEHPRQMIDKAIYGQYAGHERLGAAMYNLKGKFANKNVYSFCMCPGGEVVNASTELGGVCVNGMSYNARDGQNSNAAIVVQIHPSQWGDNPMEGIAFQRRYEQLSYQRSGGDFAVPIQRFEDFEKSRVSNKFDEVMPTIKGKVAMVNLVDVLGEDISSSIKEAINYWDRVIKGYSMGDAVLTGIESRTSSPIRILRGDNLQSVSIEGLYPCGEGAGYAGGIMSAAIDGIKCALKIIVK